MTDYLGDTFGPAVIDDLLVQRKLLRAERDAALAEVERMRAMVTIATAEELDALPERSVIRDKHGDVGVLYHGRVHYPETAPLTRQYVAKRHLPATILYRPDIADAQRRPQQGPGERLSDDPEPDDY